MSDLQYRPLYLDGKPASTIAKVDQIEHLSRIGVLISDREVHEGVAGIVPAIETLFHIINRLSQEAYIELDRKTPL